MAGIVGRYLVGNTELLACVAEQGLNPISDGIEWGTERGEEILSEEPFEARLTTVVVDEGVSIRVGDDLSVLDVTRESISEDGC